MSQGLIFMKTLYKALYFCYMMVTLERFFLAYFLFIYINCHKAENRTILNDILFIRQS